MAEPAVDAFGHVDIVARRAARSVGTRLGLDGDRLGRADRLAELAGDAALLAVGIAAQHVLAAEARADRPLLVGVVDRSEEHTSALQSLMSTSYDVLCLIKQKT